MCIKYMSMCYSIKKAFTHIHALHCQHVQVALQSSELWICLILLSPA